MNKDFYLKRTEDGLEDQDGCVHDNAIL